MIISFKNRGTEDVFNGQHTKKARKVCPVDLWPSARRKIDQLDSVIEVNELKISPGNRLEALNGDRQGEYSIRIGQQYRICFQWSLNGPELVEIIDYH